MIHIELLPFTNKQTRTIKYTCDTGYMYMDLSSLVYFTLSNLIHLKFYLILVFVMWSAPRIATSGQVQHRKSAIHGFRFVNHKYDYRLNWTTRCPVTN